MKRSEPNRKLNIWVARSVPLLVLGIIGYVSWVITKLICVNYLLRAQPEVFERLRTGPAIAILTTYYILIFFVVLCYGRLIDVVARRPGLVPRGPQYHVEKQRKKREAGEEKSVNSQSSDIASPVEHFKSRPTTSKGTLVGDFWKRDVFVCNYDGRPNFCSSCHNWKPDRSHHCSELDRCVLKMDHFCPWVGGVVGETSFKFFIQFTFWATLLCLHILITTAYFLAQRLSTFDALNVHWAVTVALSGLFAIFAGGMCGSSLHFAFTNSTTIENLNRKRQVWCLAIYIPEHRMQQVYKANGDDLRLITYPRPEGEQLQFVAQQDPSLPGLNMQSQTATSSDAVPPGPLRTFGIFETRPGENPWDIGSVENFQDLMGYTIWEWFLPFHLSPLTDHESTDSFYKLGASVDKIRRRAGIIEVGGASGIALKPKSRRHYRKYRGSSRPSHDV